MEILSTHTRREAERGVTLVETLVALLILSFVAIATLAMFSQGMRLNAAGADYAALVNEAKDVSENLLARGFNDAELLADTDFTETRSNPPVVLRWRVAEHFIAQGTEDPATVWGDRPMVSTAAGSGNVKVIQLTVASQGGFAIGRRSVTVQLIRDNSVL